jgi:hypothetical protein
MKHEGGWVPGKVDHLSHPGRGFVPADSEWKLYELDDRHSPIDEYTLTTDLLLGRSVRKLPANW